MHHCCLKTKAFKKWLGRLLSSRCASPAHYSLVAACCEHAGRPTRRARRRGARGSSPGRAATLPSRPAPCRMRRQPRPPSAPPPCSCHACLQPCCSCRQPLQRSPAPGGGHSLGTDAAHRMCRRHVQQLRRSAPLRAAARRRRSLQLWQGTAKMVAQRSRPAWQPWRAGGSPAPASPCQSSLPHPCSRMPLLLRRRSGTALLRRRSGTALLRRGPCLQRRCAQGASRQLCSRLWLPGLQLTGTVKAGRWAAVLLHIPPLQCLARCAER